MSALDPKAIEAAVRALVTAQETNLGIEVSMPVVHAGGQGVSVTVVRQNDRYMVHDGSAGTMLLSGSGIRMDRRMHDRLTALVATYGCEFSAGRVYTTCTEQQVPVALVLVANASRAVGDAVRTASDLAEAGFDNKVTEILRQTVGKRLRERDGVVGDSGKTYIVSHVILDATLSRPAAFVEAVPQSEAVPRRVAEFLDLMGEYPDVAREAIYDDSVTWGAHNLVLLGKVSNPVPCSVAADRMRLLAA